MVGFLELFFFIVVEWVSLRVCLEFSLVKRLYVLKGFRFYSVSCARPRSARRARELPDRRLGNRLLLQPNLR